MLAFEAVHVRSGEEARQLIIGKHTNVEVLDDNFDRFVPADPVINGDRLGLAEVCQHFHNRDWSISALPAS